MLNLLQKNAYAAPPCIFATHLNAPCSSILLAHSSAQKVYLIIGKTNGEAVFFPVDRSECVSKFESELNDPITGLAAGDLQNNGHRELVTVSSNGLLQALNFPQSESPNEPPIPDRIFFQQLNSNICSCEIMDIDMDGQNEFLVVMTDRVVRSYRFQTDAYSLIALSKWEMPSQISGLSIGISENYFAYLSQACTPVLIRLDFGTTKDVRIIPSSMVDRKRSTLLFIPPNPKVVRLMQSLVQKVIVWDGITEVALHNTAGDFVCVAHTRLLCGINVVSTICPFGNLQIYGFTSNNIITEPIARCQILRDIDHAAAYPGPSNYTMFLSIVNIYNKVAIYLIDLGHIIQVK